MKISGQRILGILLWVTHVLTLENAIKWKVVSVLKMPKKMMEYMKKAIEIRM